MTAKRVIFTGGTGKAGRHALPYLKDKGYDLLNVDLKPSEHPEIRTLIADLTDSGQAFNALTTHFDFKGFRGGKHSIIFHRYHGSRTPQIRTDL